ncbi:hypothetical protein VTN49DRAFT_7400 [Thermomyces lanuginosus]|uniref:uncharacterized protein n=1 Tax=Thermomyces lanuginosus TaxID=5541 RepID=UPI00374274EE
MRWLSIGCLATWLSLSPMAAAIHLLKSSSLNPCIKDSNITASLFNVVFTPDNNTFHVDINGVSDISGHIRAKVEAIAYGYTIVSEILDPCKMNIEGLCPMYAGPLNMESNIPVGEDLVKQIPSIAYNIPDLDGKVRAYIYSAETNKTIACVEADLSNGKTVYQRGVQWTVAVIAGMGLVASAITSGLGHSNTAAHVAANALSLFGFFQAQAMIGETSVELPPIVAAWTQNFQWSMGIIRVGFLQTIATWYQRATGGTPSTTLQSLSTVSVQVEKRALDFAGDLVRRGVDALVKRQDNLNTGESAAAATETKVVRGLERVAFVANMEVTNLFLTGLIFYVVFVALVMGGVAAFKWICEALVKSGKMASDKFLEFRNGWKIVMRGILYRLAQIGWAQMCVFCLWELTVRDSAAEVLLAVVMFLSVAAVLGWASAKVVMLAKRSEAMHKNPAYILYSDPTALNKWGFLYVQYRATAYYFVIPVLGYLLIKGMFIAFAQKASVVQAVALLIIEAAFLIAVSVIRPWMDKKTNVFNISIAAINFLNAIFLLMFTEVFKQPPIVTGVIGVVFFVINVIFALVLLILVLIASVYAVVSKNPDMRYQPMRDDRASFTKSQTQLTAELDALGATARGGDTMEMRDTPKRPNFDEEASSFSSGTGASINRQPPPADMKVASPVDPSVPLFPSNTPSPHPGGPPPAYESSRPQTPSSRTMTDSPFNPSSALAIHEFRSQHNRSPWQRGAGYDH